MHTPPPIPDLQKIASALLELTGTSIAELARKAELHRPNLVSWLGGKDHVLAPANQLKACDILGWRDGRLRRNCIHRWGIENDIAFLSGAISLLEPSDTDWGFASVADGAAEIGGVLLGLLIHQPPLLILIARNRSHTPCLPLNQELPTQVRTTSQALNARQIDWVNWYEDFQNHETATFLSGAAQYAFCELWPQSYTQLAGLAIETDPNVIKQQWLSLLAQAHESGVDMQQLISQVRKLLPKQD